MLKDLQPLSSSDIELYYKELKKLNPSGVKSKEKFKISIGVHPSCHLETGIYEFRSPNFPNGFTFIPNAKQVLQCMDKYNDERDYDDPDSKYISSYGVADSIEQIKDYYHKAIEDKEHNYFIYVNKIIQKEEPSEYGWRWHKWGPYIGNLQPKHEYIYDENFGPDWKGFVYCFKIIEMD